ncbi:hypothetical protein [Sulfuricurvum sp.]|uniref:hypothetical protein n=1 Tax=Sulfuricurvum sp. TaxID=2025608 RepID=UPI0035648FE6
MTINVILEKVISAVKTNAKHSVTGAAIGESAAAPWYVSSAGTGAGPLPTDASRETKQDSQIALETTLNGLITTLNGLVTAIKDTDGIKKILDAVAVTGTVAVSNGFALETGGNLAAIATDAAAIETVLTPVVDANNSSTVALGISGVFTGTATDMLLYGSVLINAFSNVASAAAGISVQWSSDGTNWDIIPSTYYVAAAVAGARTITQNKLARYMRVVYTNGGTGQTTFRLQTILVPYPANDSGFTGESTYAKRGTMMYGQSTANTLVAPTISGLGNADDVATTYSGILTYPMMLAFDGTNWDRVRCSPTSHVLRTLGYPDRPASDLGAAIIAFNHGTVTADWSADSATAVAQSGTYNLWVTGLSIYTGTDPTAECAVQEIPIQVIISDTTDGQNRWFGTLSLPTNGNITFSTPILIAKGHSWQTILKLGGATNLDLIITVNGFEEA